MGTIHFDKCWWYLENIDVYLEPMDTPLIKMRDAKKTNRRLAQWVFYILTQGISWSLQQL